MVGGGGVGTYPVPIGYVEKYAIVVGKAAKFDGGITLDTSVTGADVIIEIDDGAENYTAIDSTTYSFTAATEALISVIFGAAVPWVGVAPLGDRRVRVRVSGGTPTMTEYIVLIGLEVYESPIITNPTISDAAITQNESTTITATVNSVTTHATVVVHDTLGAPVYAQDMVIVAGVAIALIPGAALPVGTYAAGQVHVIALDSTGAYGDIDSSLSLVVSAASGALLQRVSEAYRALIRNDARFSAVDDDAVLIVYHEDDMQRVTAMPSVCIIPESDLKREATCRLDEHELKVWLAPVVAALRTDREDTTFSAELLAYMTALEQLTREQDDDPDKRLGGIALSLIAKAQGGRQMPVRDRRAMIGFVEVSILVRTDENGTVV